MNKDGTASSSGLVRPIGAVLAMLNTLPGVGLAREMAGSALDAVGSLPPRTRRVAVYTGAGLLGLVGAIEWPIAAAVVTVAWLTQSRFDAVSPTPARPEHATASVAVAKLSEPPGGSAKPPTTSSRTVAAATPPVRRSTSRAKARTNTSAKSKN